MFYKKIYLKFAFIYFQFYKKLKEKYTVSVYLLINS